MEFVGRESELGLLGRIFAEERVKTCMVYGRRRIGKTSTILKFIEGRRSLYIDLVRGPEVRNVRRIADKLEEAFGIKPDVRDLRSVLESVKGVCSQGKTVVIFDELPYLIHNNPYAASEGNGQTCWSVRNNLQENDEGDGDGSAVRHIFCSERQMEHHRMSRWNVPA